MPDTGYAMPSVGESLDRLGGVAWTNADGIVTLGNTADCNFGADLVSDWLVARGFNFDLAGVTVTGVQVLVIGGFIAGSAALGTVIGGVVTSLGVGKNLFGDPVGGASDMWSTSLSAADIAADTFAVLIVESGDEFGGTANIVSVQAKIYYTGEVEPEVPFVGHLDGHNVTPMVWRR